MMSISYNIDGNKNYPRVSVVNCVSEALEMLRFSSEQLIENAGTDNFDYIIVCWNTTPAVDAYILELQKQYTQTYPRLKIVRIDHREVPKIGYVPNLRAMMNDGFTKAFELNEYGGLVNTDQAFYKDWFINLVKHCAPKKMVSSLVVMPRAILRHYQADFGVTEYGEFDMERFQKFCAQVVKSSQLKTEEDLRGDDFLYNVGFPYLFPRNMWLKAGPWELTLSHGTPDVNFFKRAHKSGFKFVVSGDSIVYHLEGAERGKAGRPAPEFSKNMQYDPISFAGLKIKLKAVLLKLFKKLGIIKKDIIV